MADSRISDLSSLTGANIATGDLLEIVDVSDTTLAATGTNKKTTAAGISTFVQAQTKITTIASGSLPAAATQSFTSIPATYAYLVLELSGVSSNTATRHPQIQLSTNNGVSYDTTAANYPGTYTDGGGTAVGSVTEATIGGMISNDAATTTWTINITIWGYQGGPHAQWLTVATSSVGAIRTAVGTYRGSTSAINAIQVLWSGTGNFDAGTYALYGVN